MELKKGRPIRINHNGYAENYTFIDETNDEEYLFYKSNGYEGRGTIAYVHQDQIKNFNGNKILDVKSIRTITDLLSTINEIIMRDIKH